MFSSQMEKDIIQQLQEQMAVRQFQELLSRVIPSCFDKCIKKPGIKLESFERVSAYTDMNRDVSWIVQTCTNKHFTSLP